MVGSCQRPGEGPQEGKHRAARAAREESRRVAALARRTPVSAHPAVVPSTQTTSTTRSTARGTARGPPGQPCAIPSVMPFKN